MKRSEWFRKKEALIRHYFPGVKFENLTDEEFAKLSGEADWLHYELKNKT